MDIKKIKAPEKLKSKTINLMENEINKPNRNKKFSLKRLMPATAFLLVFVLVGFAYDYFSGIKGDDLAFNTEYKGNGIVYIEVENNSHKELKFTKGVLKTFQDNEELIYINEKGDKDLPCVMVDMPVIKGGEKGEIIIDLSEIDYKKLEEPIVFNDGFVFVLTNDNFQFGQNWMTAVRFGNEIRGSDGKARVLELKNEDNTNLDYIKEIKENYAIKNPLSEIIITFKYDSSMKNPRVSLGADKGTEIYAMADGVVIKPEYNSFIGKSVIINHSDDFLTEYWHCEEILVENGQYVKAGDIIAKVGATGRATGPHLSLIAKYKGEYINPSLLFDDETITLSLNENDLNIGFISRGKKLNFKDSLAIQKYLENEFDFDFDSLNYNFTFSYLSNSPSFIYDKNIDVIFADRALDWEDSEVVSDYSLQSLYDAGYYRLKNIDTYFESKYDLFIPFYKSLRTLTNDKIYFYPALITPDVNNDALQVYSKGNENADKEQVVNMQAFYNDDYYFIKRGDSEPAKNRFDKKGNYIISAKTDDLAVNSFFEQTVYVLHDNDGTRAFLDLVFDEKRLEKQYSTKLKIKESQIENSLPTIIVDNLSDLFDEVLLDNVKYDINSIYNTKNSRITYLGEEFKFEFDNGFIYRPEDRIDNTNIDFIKEIKSNYKLAQVLDNIDVTSLYDENRENSDLCLKAEIGDEIYAMADGVVKEQGYDKNKGDGNYIIIEHSEDFSTKYSHCSEVLLNVGDDVKAGDVIAKAGATGRVTGAQLGLSASYKDESINPLLLFSDEVIEKLRKSQN